MDRAAYTGLILAGGLGSRMQPAAGAYVEKGLLMLRGEPLAAHACRALAPQCRSLLISANRELPRYSEFAPVIADDPALGGDLGPLAGLERGLACAGTPWLAVMPVDVLNIPADMVERLAEAARQTDSPAAFALHTHEAPHAHEARHEHESQHGRQRAHPLCAIVHASLAADLRAWLQGGNRKVQMWMAHAGALAVPFEGEGIFVNINTPQDLARAEAA